MPVRIPRQGEIKFEEPKRKKATSLSEANRNLKAYFSENVTQVLRPELNRLVKHELKIVELIDQGAKLTTSIPKMAATLSNFYALAANQGYGIGNETSVEGGGGAKVFGRVESAFDEVKRKTKSLFDARFFNGKEFGHKDVTIVGTRLVGFIEACESLEREIRNVRSKRPGRNPTREETIEKLPVKQAGLQAKTIGELRKAKRAAQKMLIGSEVLQKLPTNNTLNSQTKWMNLAEEVNKINNLQEFLTSTKRKYFDVLQGKASIELTVELKNDNQFKAFYEKAFGANLSKIARGTVTKLDKNLQNEFLNTVDVTGLKGSPSIEGKIVKDLAKIASGQKVQKGKYSESARTRMKPATYKMQKFTSGKRLSKLAKQAKDAANFVKGTNLVAPVTRERGGSNTQREINKLRMQINRRLPAEVRREMGRPALINRTGTFSNSVQLTSLRQGPKTLVGTYTYQANPYRTFENEGARQWPVGYNPKPLIARSIRNLAEQYTVEKFTLRRQ